MIILRTIKDFYPKITGPANQAYYVSKYLHRYYRWNSIIVTINDKDRSIKVEDLGFATIIRLPLLLAKKSLLEYGLAKGYYSLLTQIEPSIVHNHGYRNYFCDISFLLKNFLNFKRVVSCHGSVLMYRHIHINKLKWIPYLLYDALTAKQILKRADAIIASSKQEKNELISIGVPSEKIWIISMGVTMPDYVNNQKIENENYKDLQKEKIIFLTVGRWEPSRRLEIIVKAFEKVYRSYPDTELWIVGTEAGRSIFIKGGYLTYIKQLVKRLGLSKSVKFRGELRGEDLQRAYLHADIFIYASLYENFGQTILEAASLGLPVISTPVGIAPEIIVNNETGFLYDFDDYNALAEKMILMIRDVSLRKHCSKNIKNLVREKFSWDKIIVKYKILYESLNKQ